MSSFGDRLKSLRIEKRMTQSDLVKAMRELNPDMQRQTLGMWETGKAIPRHETLLWLAQYFNKSLDFLIEGKEPVGATRKIPIVGMINSLPVLSAENIIGEAEVPILMVRDGMYFQIIVRDESMSGAGLREGYRVLVREQTDLQDGQIGLVKVGRETLIRKVYTTDGAYLLISGNSAYPEVKVGKDAAMILGRARVVSFEV